MKFPFLFCLGFSLAGAALAADTPSAFDAELAKLSAQRDKAEAEAVAQLNRQYREALEQLQKRATQSGDLDGALKIRAEIQRVAALPAGSPVGVRAGEIKIAAAPKLENSVPGASKNIFVGKKWLWCTDADPKSGNHGSITFLENGKVRLDGEVESFLGSWSEVSRWDIKVHHSRDAGGWIFHYDTAKGEARSIKGKGSWDNQKWLRPAPASEDPVPSSTPTSPSKPASSDGEDTPLGKRAAQ